MRATPARFNTTPCARKLKPRTCNWECIYASCAARGWRIRSSTIKSPLTDLDTVAYSVLWLALGENVPPFDLTQPPKANYGSGTSSLENGVFTL